MFMNLHIVLLLSFSYRMELMEFRVPRTYDSNGLAVGLSLPYE